MGLLNTPASREPRPWREDPISRIVGMVTIAVFGVLLGIQYWTPNRRVIPVVAALMVFGVAWRLSMVAAINVLMLILPFPKGTVFGSTNLAFIMIVFVIWLLRLSLRTSPAARSSPIDLPVFGLVLWYILSFYNIRSEYGLLRGIQSFEIFASCVVLYYLVVNSVHTQRDLERVHLAQMTTALLVFLIAAWEARNAGKVLIPGLLDFSGTLGHDFNTADVRVGSSFSDYELLSEYCGIILLLVAFQFFRARSNTRRVVIGLFGLFSAYTMFTTVTRGVVVALMIAVPYLFFHIRRRLNPVRFLSAAFIIMVLALSMNYTVAKFTNSGDLYQRLLETKLVHGIVPEAREDAWLNAFERSLVHPIIGQGPYYDAIPGYKLWWPHNVYLYVANLVGFPGLFFFLWILWGLFALLRPVVDDLQHESYADAYLIIARAQMLVFMLNELKIDYLRNNVYQFQVWLLFGTWTAGYLVSRDHGVRALLPQKQPGSPPAGRLAA